MKNGQYEAFATNRVLKPYQGHMSEAERERVAILWEQDEANKLAKLVNPSEILSNPYNGPIVEKIGVVVVGDEAYLDVSEPPIKVGEIFSSAHDFMQAQQA